VHEPPQSHKPRVAVIVPAYNRADLLPQAVDSVLAQTFEDWELVIADDASSDDTYAVAARYAERRPGKITALKLERNLGIAGARNEAIKASRGGELVMLLDSDDYLREDYLEHMVGVYDREVARGRRIGVVNCNALLDSPDGIMDETYAEFCCWSDEIDYDQMIKRNYLLARVIFSQAAYDEVGPLSPECMSWDDYDMWLRMLEAGYEVATTRETVAYYRVHPGSITRNNEAFVARGGIVALNRALERDAISPRRRRAVKARLRHLRALRARGLFRDAVSRRQPLQASRWGLEAAPRGLVAFLQDPARWGEWAGDMRAAISRRAPAARHASH